MNEILIGSDCMLEPPGSIRMKHFVWLQTFAGNGARAFERNDRAFPTSRTTNWFKN